MYVSIGDLVLSGVGGIRGLGAAGMDYMRTESLYYWTGRAGITFSGRKMGR